MRFALLALAALIGAQEPARTPMMWNLKKGQKVRYEFNHRVVTGSMDHTSQIELTLVIGLEGGDLGADRTNAINLTMERIALVNTGTGERKDYDSARDKEPPASSYPRVLSKCVGKTLAMRLGPSGNLVTYDEIRRMIQNAVDAWPDLKGRSSWDKEGIDSRARGLQWLLRLGFETPKGGPTAAGDRWESKYDGGELMRGLGSAVCQARVKSIGKGEAQVEQTMKFEFGEALAGIVKEASGKGAFAWDTERGMLKTLGATSKFVTIHGDTTHTVTVVLLSDAPPK